MLNGWKLHNRLLELRKMITEFKLIFEGKPDIDIRRFQKSLPEDFLVQEREDGIYIVIPSSLPEEERYQYLVDRQGNRIKISL